MRKWFLLLSYKRAAHELERMGYIEQAENLLKEADKL